MRNNKESGINKFISKIGYLENIYIGIVILITTFLLDILVFKYSISTSVVYSFISLIFFYIINLSIFFILHPLFSSFSKKNMRETFFKVSFLEFLYILIGLLTSSISLLISNYVGLLLIFLILVNISIWILFSYLFAIVYEIKPSQAFLSLVVLISFLTILVLLFFFSFSYLSTYTQPSFNF